MNRRAVLAIVALVLVAAGTVWFVHRPRGPAYYTGFVEGEERVLRSEVTGRVLEVPYAEGAAVPADGIVARLDEQDIQARLASKQHELDVLDADIRTQEERITLVQTTWQRDVSAHRAELDQAEAGSRLAERTYAREAALVRTGISPAQTLDRKMAHGFLLVQRWESTSMHFGPSNPTLLTGEAVFGRLVRKLRGDEWIDEHVRREQRAPQPRENGRRD